MARVAKINTTVANLGISAAPAFFLVSDPGALATGFNGINATNGTGAPYYVKLFWTGNANLTYSQLSAVLTNAACTVIPAMTIQVPTTGLMATLDFPVQNGQGQLYLWATSTAADATNTSLSAGGDVINVFID